MSNKEFQKRTAKISAELRRIKNLLMFYARENITVGTGDLVEDYARLVDELNAVTKARYRTIKGVE